MGLLDKLLSNKETVKSKTIDEVAQKETLGQVSKQDKESASTSTSTGQKKQTGQLREQAQRDADERSSTTKTGETQKEEQTNIQSREEGQTVDKSQQTQVTKTQTQQVNDLARLLSEVLTGTEKGSENRQQALDRQSEEITKGSTLFSSFDTEDRANVQALLAQFTKDDSGIGDFITSLQERAGTAEKTLKEQNARILDAARHKGVREIGQREQLLAQTAGSSLNSLVQLSAAELEKDLDVQLAGLEAQLDQQARAQQTEEYAQVLQGFGTQGSAASQIAEALSRGRQQTTQTGERLGKESQTIKDLIERLTTTTQEKQQQETAQETLQSMTQDELTAAIDRVRQQSKDTATTSLTSGVTKQQEQTATEKVLSELVNRMQDSSSEELSSQDIATALKESMEAEEVSEATKTGISQSLTTGETRERKSLFDGVIDILKL